MIDIEYGESKKKCKKTYVKTNVKKPKKRQSNSNKNKSRTTKAETECELDVEYSTIKMGLLRMVDEQFYASLNRHSSSFEGSNFGLIKCGI